MAENNRFDMDQDDIVRTLVTTIENFIQDRLNNKEHRTQQREQCAERLAAEDGNSDNATVVRYSDQAVLANLDWGMDALEEAISTSNVETKMARLDHAEKMLQVCAMLHSSQKTAGVPNFYLSAWAHLNLAYLWGLRNDVTNAVVHVLEMFLVDPFFSRTDFAPELWKSLFLPHMNSIVGWYTEERHRTIMDVIPDSADLSLTVDFGQYFDESLILSMRPDQAEKMENLEKQYVQSLDENTRLYAKYYKESMNFDSASTKKVIPLMPIAEPPMTPLHEVSRKIPDYVKFGPILPKNAGFSPVLRAKEIVDDASRLSSSHSSPNQKDSAMWHIQEEISGRNEDDSGYEPDEFAGSENRAHNVNKDIIIESRARLLIVKSQVNSPRIYSPVDSPRASARNSPKTEPSSRKESPSILRLRSSRTIDAMVSSSLPSAHPFSDFSTSSADSDSELRELKRSARKSVSSSRSTSYANIYGQNSQLLEVSSFKEEDEYEGSQSSVSLPSSEKSTSQSRPPKDFVCAITGQIFSDPVTLETGQTYERKAIEEWIKRGNTTCPITRQPISGNALPKTNYVLKRLITSWKEQHPDLSQESPYCETSSSPSGSPSKHIPSRASNLQDHSSSNRYSSYKPRRFMQAEVSTSPTSVISQAATETIITGLKPFITCLCNSEDLKECEAAVLTVARMWKDSHGDPGVHSYLSTPATLSGFMDVLSASLNREVLRTSIYVLSELIIADDRVAELLTNVDSDFDSLAALLKNGLSEACVLIYLLKPVFSQLSDHNLLPSLIKTISSKSEDPNEFELIINPKDAAILLVEQALMGGDESSRSFSAVSIISANAVPALLKSLDRMEARHSVVSILLCCMQADRSCRNLVASRIDLCPVLELFHAGDDQVKGTCIDFLLELVQLKRRTLCNQILQIIKDEGAFSTMHSFLVYLQMAPMEQQPAIAALLLQLDLLVEPRKMSIYREEAIEALIEALSKKDFPNCQIIALDALLSLSGHLSASGKSYTEAWLLKLAGFDQPYNALVKTEKLKTNEKEVVELEEEDEKAESSWERRVAFVLCNHEKGRIFNALEECLKSNSIDMAKTCLVTATWLIYMLYNLPDTGIRDTARKSTLDQFIYILQSSKNLEDKILASVALRSFVSDPGTLGELGGYAKCMYKTLRKLKRKSVVVGDIMKALMNLPSVNAAEMWCSSEGLEVDSSINGEVLALLYIKGRVLSSHSDGTIKVWDAGKRVSRLIQEVREHAKAVTCLYVPPSSEKLYSGSLDKTIRIWVVKPEGIHCIQVHDVKETVYGLTADANFACFFSQATGVKVCSWSGVFRHINFSKNVKCLAMIGDKLYCGCSAFSIQEVDLRKFTTTIFYTGSRKLLGKQSVNSLYIHDNHLFAGGSSVDGTAGKVFSLSTKAVTGSLLTGFDIHCIDVNNDYIFAATKCGIIEVWLKERFARVASIKMGSGGATKITSLTSDREGEMLFAGSSEGKIQAWDLD